MRISKGDTIGIIALSGECDWDKIEQATTNLETIGYKVKLSKNIFDKNRYLAGSDESKLEELHRFFADPKIKLILCARGGYGAIRLISRIDYNLIKANPKPFCGYSDVTALLLMIYKRAGLITYHSPMVYDFITPPQPSPSKEGVVVQTISNFFETINNNKFEYKADKVLNEGSASGILWGGNLSTVVSLCGQDFIPDEDFIFFTEDVNEPVYKIDKMFQQLINIDRFSKHCKGIILGEFTGADDEDWLSEYFEELSAKLNLPMIQHNGITHSENKITLPIGTSAKINNDILISC